MFWIGDDCLWWFIEWDWFCVDGDDGVFGKFKRSTVNFGIILVEFFFVFGVYGLNFNPNFYSDYISLILLLLDGNYSFFWIKKLRKKIK